MTTRLHIRPSFMLLLAATLHGCGDAPADTGPGGVSAEDARQLDNAASTLDAESQPANTGDAKPAD